MQKGLRRGFPVLVPVASIFLTLVLVEIFLAVFFPIPYSMERNMIFQSDPYTGYRLKPNSIGHFQQGMPAVANGRGHRDDEVAQEKPDGVYRILVLGDSFTVGANVAQDAAYPQVLESLLRVRLGEGIEVVNSGVGGWSPFQYAQYYEHYGRELNPDMVLIGFFVGNDTYSLDSRVEQLRTAVLGRRVSRNAAEKPATKFLVFLHEHSHLARLLMPRGPVAERVTRDNCSDFSDQYLAIQRTRKHNHLKESRKRKSTVANNSVRMIRRIHQLADAQKALAVVVMLPDENQINPALQERILKDDDRSRYDFSMPQSLLSELFSELHIPTIDLLPAFLADPRCLYMNDTHWTPEGHRLAAELIASELVPIIRRND